MGQRLDDVTGEPIRMSAVEREAQRKDILTAANAAIQHVTFLSGVMREMAGRIEALETALSDAHAMLGAQAVSLEAFRHGQTRWERLRWLVTGR